MKTSKADFKRFRRTFLFWQQRLSLNHYRAHFEHQKREDCYAEIVVHEPGRVATVYLTSENDNSPETVNGNPGVEANAKHESLHLMLYRLAWLGKQRWVGSDEIDNEVEAVIRRLEKVLK